MSFTVYPAIDVRDGQVVRLVQGDYAQQTTYGDDPLALAQRYAKAGAQWLHLVDLDAARAGGYTLLPLLQSLATRSTLKVQTGGGVRSESDVARLLDAGAQRVVIGSLAVREPETVAGWIARFGAEHITVALDTRQDAQGSWRLPVHGWTEDGERELDDLAAAYAAAGLHHLLCTDIARDGMLSGPNQALYQHLLAQCPTLAVQASGGVRDLDDVIAARASGCTGVVLGKALLEGHLELAEALAC
ncbi:MAG: 1-(5-phosphoribosyl)-5-[(5-phosphoribosylamino)methylideneamino]imidazole-4-carboxamide isomerase [Gammaproteobacteria bacterium HGW-Gammaproteobacteria-2]|jgi:phosphoribosylformimino-5-aminoimidazole carboxamide ribotide isomerase|nr:MAG: 1-(5-phosphoribosyl)-5-[(5-phosphoribosylamino)methylideneamino]imidazole-4-carboxamide isomerase [Gammaproteobacteria bacterium HGW-Gammaproteobacteria-2]